MVSRAFLCLALLSCPATSFAQSVDPGSLSDADLVALREAIARQLEREAPVSITGIRSGFGLSFGQIAAGAGLTDRRERRFEGDWDASLSFAFGLLPQDSPIGATLGVDITSVSPFHFGQSGTMGLTLTHRLAPMGDWQGSLALGAENLVTWGDSTAQSVEYFVAGSWHRPGDQDAPPLLLSVGYGTGEADGGGEAGLFGGVGLGLTDRSAGSLAWTGDEVIAAVSFWPDAPRGTMLSVGVGDLTNRIDGRRAILALTWTGSF
jgi:hypothetical protein